MNEFVLELPFVPQSLKNSQKFKTGRWGRRYVGASDQAVHDIERIREEAAVLLVGRRLPIWPSDSMRVEHFYDSDLGTVRVAVRPLCPEPDGRNGRKRDLDNITEAIHDALQGLVYADDRQIALITKTRLVGGRPA